MLEWRRIAYRAPSVGRTVAPSSAASVAAGSPAVPRQRSERRVHPRRPSTTRTSTPPPTGGEKAAGELGGQFTQVGPRGATAAAQIPFIQDATTQGVDAIVVSATGADEVAPALTAAMAAGIKVVGYDSSPAVGAYDVFVNQTDFSLIGGAMAEWACELAPDCTGEIAILSATATATNQNAWIERHGDRADDGSRSSPTSSSSTPSTATTTPPRAPRRPTACSQKYPNLKVIVAPTTVGILAAAQVVKQASRTRSRSPASASRTT